MSTFVAQKNLNIHENFPKVDTQRDLDFFPLRKSEAPIWHNNCKRSFCVTKMKKKNKKGFTLLELLISFAIVSILLLGAVELTLHSLHARRTSDCNLESAELASDKLEFLKSLFFDSPELEENSYVERVMSQKREDVFVREWMISDITPRMKKIEVVCYSESYTRRRTSIVLFYSRELGF